MLCRHRVRTTINLSGLSSGGFADPQPLQLGEKRVRNFGRFVNACAMQQAAAMRCKRVAIELVGRQ